MVSGETCHSNKSRSCVNTPFKKISPWGKRCLPQVLLAHVSRRTHLRAAKRYLADALANVTLAPKIEFLMDYAQRLLVKPGRAAPGQPCGAALLQVGLVLAGVGVLCPGPVEQAHAGDLAVRSAIAGFLAARAVFGRPLEAIVGGKDSVFCLGGGDLRIDLRGAEVNGCHARAGTGVARNAV